VQQFHLVPGPVDKDVYRAVFGVPVQTVYHKAAKAVETLAHIGGAAVELEAVGSAECEHL